jgi:hypothetical protein
LYNEIGLGVGALMIYAIKVFMNMHRKKKQVLLQKKRGVEACIALLVYMIIPFEQAVTHICDTCDTL